MPDKRCTAGCCRELRGRRQAQGRLAHPPREAPCRDRKSVTVTGFRSRLGCDARGRSEIGWHLEWTWNGEAEIGWHLEWGPCNWNEPGRDNDPINCVFWNQARTFCIWAGGRLPSEAEWEYAARGSGQDIEYPWGDEVATCERMVGDDGLGCGNQGSLPVCSKPLGNSAQGLCDLAGNVWEHVQDRYHDSYTGAPADGSSWEGPGDLRIVRGGSYASEMFKGRVAYPRV